MTLTHWIITGVAAGLAGIWAYLYAVSWIETHQALDLEKIPAFVPSRSVGKRSSNAAVVFFSRSGNTALAARQVAARINARLIRIDAPKFRLGVLGLIRATLHANARRNSPNLLPEILPESLDLKAFETVWIGSPVWLYSPAPPAWAFIERNRFEGQDVVLFNTFNSHIGADYIARFRDKVMAHGARSFEHRQVLRGRMTHQISPKQMQQEIDGQWFP